MPSLRPGILRYRCAKDLWWWSRTSYVMIKADATAKHSHTLSAPALGPILPLQRYCASGCPWLPKRQSASLRTGKAGEEYGISRGTTYAVPGKQGQEDHARVLSLPLVVAYEKNADMCAACTSMSRVMWFDSCVALGVDTESLFPSGAAPRILNRRSQITFAFVSFDGLAGIGVDPCGTRQSKYGAAHAGTAPYSCSASSAPRWEKKEIGRITPTDHDGLRISLWPRHPRLNQNQKCEELIEFYSWYKIKPFQTTCLQLARARIGIHFKVDGHETRNSSLFKVQILSVSTLSVNVKLEKGREIGHIFHPSERGCNAAPQLPVRTTPTWFSEDKGAIGLKYSRHEFVHGARAVISKATCVARHRRGFSPLGGDIGAHMSRGDHFFVWLFKMVGKLVSRSPTFGKDDDCLLWSNWPSDGSAALCCFWGRHRKELLLFLWVMQHTSRRSPEEQMETVNPSIFFIFPAVFLLSPNASTTHSPSPDAADSPCASSPIMRSTHILELLRRQRRQEQTARISWAPMRDGDLWLHADSEKQRVQALLPDQDSLEARRSGQWRAQRKSGYYYSSEEGLG
ncbi:hypothetical protein B0H16DRAFT_1701622 [Mycena metata]|uniref:Uncharacterized protein n=1 Tax=Mycena metata TaxID=1033252 RepID=A0AAD7H9Z0_9AGAR|nr:hypothetical protein B0H16DRAFT_1701622 [Mycena metata]